MYCTSLGNSRVGSVASLRTQLTEDCQLNSRDPVVDSGGGEEPNAQSRNFLSAQCEHRRKSSMLQASDPRLRNDYRDAVL
eukprot:658268-Pleurochrysis_carterae.AAC.2